MSGWPDRSRVIDGLLAEASATAKQLGHELTVPWVEFGPERRARCIRCFEAALVRPRLFALPPLAGPALTMRCPGRRA